MVSSLLLVTLVFQMPRTVVSQGLLSTKTDSKQSAVAGSTTTSTTLSPEMRGDIYMAREMYREAVETYKTGPADSAILANKIGIAYHQLLDLGDAQKYYTRAIKMSPTYAEAINNLGTIYYAHKSYRRSITQYKKALRLTPEAASILSNLGTAYFARKNYELALDTFQKALALDPDVFEHRSSMGILLQERSVDERAKYHYYLAKLYAKSGDIQHALVYIRKSLEEGFKDPNKFKQDPEFAVVRRNPEFQQIISAEHKVL